MVADDTQPAMLYPKKDEYEAWKAAAEANGLSVSEWMKCMVRAGSRKWDAASEPDVTNTELREQRNDLKRQLKSARSRVRRLENELHDTEREQVEQFIRKNPGASYGEIVQKIGDGVPGRVSRHLDGLLGERIERVGEEQFEWVGK